MYDNNIKIKSYASIIRCNNDNKKVVLYQEIKRKYSGNTFHVNTIVFCKNNMRKHETTSSLTARTRLKCGSTSPKGY